MKRIVAAATDSDGFAPIPQDVLKQLDDESAAIAVCVNELKSFDSATLNRVIQYLADRFDVTVQML